MLARCFFWCVVMLSMPGYAGAMQVQFTPDRDATLYEDAEGDVANGSGDYLFFGQTGQIPGVALRRALLHFDVSSIPANAMVTGVALQLEIDRVPIGAKTGTAAVHRVLAGWGEGASNANGEEGTGAAAESGDATWLHRSYDVQAWATDGGDFVAQASATAGYGENPQTLGFSSTAALRADVQSWVGSPGANHGWIVLGTEGTSLTARRLIARESNNAFVPLLTVDYVIPSVTDNLALTQVASGLVWPVSVANAADGSGRLFIIEKAGRIRILNTAAGTLLPTPYLDITSLVDSSGSEQGLLGLAFHPDFKNNRKFYVYYTRDPDGAGNAPDRSVVRMYLQSVGNSNVAEPVAGSEVLMEFEQNASNHNGGDLHFGADGYLYIASGDGGGSNDQYNNAQNKNTLKGKILRIDVDVSPPVGGELCGLVAQYGIPPGNAFPGAADGCDEILHLGLRNPWRFSFDAQTEEMYIGDVGQGEWEEIDYAPAGASGLNFGWPCFEGAHAGPGGGPCPNPVAPIIEFSSGTGSGNCSVTGGYVYRGMGTALFGRYVYGDYCSDRVWVATRSGNAWASEEWSAAADILDNITAFGQDERCELYVAVVSNTTTGAGLVYRIDDTEMIGRSGFEALRCQ